MMSCLPSLICACQAISWEKHARADLACISKVSYVRLVGIHSEDYIVPAILLRLHARGQPARKHEKKTEVVALLHMNRSHQPAHRNKSPVPLV